MRVPAGVPAGVRCAYQLERYPRAGMTPQVSGLSDGTVPTPTQTQRHVYPGLEEECWWSGMDGGLCVCLLIYFFCCAWRADWIPIPQGALFPLVALAEPSAAN